MISGEILGAFAEPEAPETFGAFLDRLSLPDSRPDAGPWQWRAHPLQRAFAKFVDERWRRMVLLGPAQDGKSVILSALALYHITQLKRSVVYAATDRGLGASLYRTKMRPMAERSGLAQFFPYEGPGSGTGVPREIHFKSGADLFLLGAGAQNGAGQAGVTCHTSLIDEAGKMRPAQRQWLTDRVRGKPEESLVIFLGTLEKDSEDQLVALWETSTAARFYYPCAQCGVWFAFAFSRLKYDPTDEKTAAETARLNCPTCGLAHDDHARRDLLFSGQILHRGQTISGPSDSPVISGEVPRISTAGLRWSGFDSPIRRLGAIASEHRTHQRLIDLGETDEPMRQFFHMELVEQMPLTAGRLDFNEPKMVSIAQESDYHSGECPPDTTRAVLAVDVQLRSHYWLILAETPRGWHICDWGQDKVCEPTEAPDVSHRHNALSRLDSLAKTGIKRAGDGKAIQCDVVIDTAYRPEEIRPWIARVGGRRWLACRGQGDEMASRMVRAPVGERVAYEQGWIELRTQKESPDRVQLFVDDDSILDKIASAWENGGLHLPQEIDQNLIRHLTGKRPGVKKRWEDRRTRHDWLDCLVYAIARLRLKPLNIQPQPNTRADDYAKSLTKPR